jgi:hypothetical protein
VLSDVAAFNGPVGRVALAMSSGDQELAFVANVIKVGPRCQP